MTLNHERKQIARQLRDARHARDLSTSFQTLDPLTQLAVEKGGLPDHSPETISTLHNTLNKIDRKLSPIERIEDTPMHILRFKDFARLKSGRDQYTVLALAQLIPLVSYDAWLTVHDTFEHDKQQASCLRWILRGLSVDKALRKVKTDQEITHNAINNK